MLTVIKHRKTDRCTNTLPIMSKHLTHPKSLKVSGQQKKKGKKMTEEESDRKSGMWI